MLGIAFRFAQREALAGSEAVDHLANRMPSG